MQTDTLNIPDSNGQVYRLAVNEALQALASLLSNLAAVGIITDTTTA